MTKFVLITITLLCSIVSTQAQILINEYSAANYDTYTDNYGEFEDWVELYNPTATAIDISGWTLTDKPANPTKWTVPASFIIPANGVAIIYCSGRDELIGGDAHSNFKITQTKGNEIFMLSNSGGVFQDSIRVLPHQKSHTRGRQTDGAAVWSVFTTGTPDATNVGAMQEYATTPVFSQTSGYNTAAVNLTLSSPDPNITIYYTIDGNSPDNTSTVYTTPINISTTTVVKAIAYSSTANIPPSFIDYHTFFINDTHTIPILSISGDEVDDLLGNATTWGQGSLEPQGTIEWFDENGILIDKGSGEFNKHGNDSWAYGQRGFDYVMRDQFGYNYALKDKLFMTKDRDKFQRIILKAAANDNFSYEDGAHIRDAYVHHLSQRGDLRMDERSTTACIVYRDGEYWGVYDLREKADDHDFTDYYYDQDKNNLQYLKTWGGTWSEYGGAQAQTDWDTFKNFVATNPMNITANYNTAKSQYNTGSLIDYFLLNSYVVASDWLNWNTAWWRGMDPNGSKKKWRYVLWDMDATFDHYINYTGVPNTSPNAEPCDPSSLNDPGGQGHVPIWNEMLTNQDFHDDYINRWQDLANGPLSCTFMVDLLDSMIAVIDPEMPRQITTWGGGTYADWQSNVTDLRNFILARCDSMNSGFVDCDSAITGPYDVTVEIIGIGEVEMSNGNIINDGNTPWSDQRFGGIALPFKVISGSFDHWEVLPAGAYTYDPNVDTLEIDLDSHVTVRAYFIPPVPTRDIVYDVYPSGTSTTITVDGAVINTFPTTINYVKDDTVHISPNIDPLYGFSFWSSDSVILMPSANNMTDSFYASYNDTVRLHIYELPTSSGFIYANDSICDNAKNPAQVKVAFSGFSPFTFTYAINGVNQPTITTSLNPYVINTREQGSYTLSYFADATEIGNISGEGLVTILPSPKANFEAQPDSMTILYTTTQLIDKSEGDIVGWQWGFGDNTVSDFTKNPYHTYKDSIGIYQLSLIAIADNGCADTVFNQLQITDDYWIYIPNSFTPDYDLLNDRFCISYHGIRTETFTFNVYNRFSELVYTTNNIHDLDCEKGWDGRHYDTGKELPLGVYIYEIYYQDFEGWKHQKSSEITIIR